MSRITTDIDQPEFLLVEKIALRKLKDTHERYEAQGRDLEATAMHRAFYLVFNTLQGDYEDTTPTHWGSL
jgi:hypothetical protein